MLLGYLPMALLVILTAGFGLWSLMLVNRVMEEVVQKDTVLIERTEDLSEALFSQELYGRRFLILRTEEMAELFTARGAEFKALMERSIAEHPAEAGEFARLQRLHREYEAFFSSLFAEIPQGATVLATVEDRLREKHGQAMDAARELGR
jgi:CHASE3 domain sensor protein